MKSKQGNKVPVSKKTSRQEKGSSSKKRNKRSSVKFPALQKQYTLKSRQELVDYDYVNKLSNEEKEFLNKFTEEYINAAVSTENLENQLHNTEELKQTCHANHNRRWRCIYTRASMKNNLVNFEQIEEDGDDLKLSHNPEDNLIDKIDSSSD